ncbi:MFS transporter [Streptacidiphilus monticola]
MGRAAGVPDRARGLRGALPALCACPSAGTLIAGRALLGVAAAGLVPSSLALLAGLYPDAARRTRAIGAWAALSSVGLVLGPLLGGVLTAAGGWRWVFLVNPPVALAVLAAGRGLATGRAVSGRSPLDRWGVGLSVLGLAALSFGLIEAGTAGWLRLPTLAALAVSVLSFLALGRIERRTAHPVLPPALFAMARLRADLIGAVSANFAFYGSFFFLAQRLAAWHPAEGPVRVGLSLLPMTLPICFVPLVTGRLTASFGAGPVVLAGLAGSVLGGLALASLDPHAGVPAVAGVQLLLAVSGALAIPALTASVAVTAPRELAGTAQGALNAARQSGSALGVAVIGTLATPGSAGAVLAAGAALAVGLLIAARRPN